MAVTIDPSPVAGGEAGTPPGDRRFRPDVQGLRAIAILLAIVYHADIQPFSGGYVGIEVFFVISGFVITGLLLRERDSTGHTSLRSFYGRRARRIIPMATLVIIVTVIVTYHSLGTLVGHETAVDGAWSALFLANVHFQATDTNYLLSQAPPSPLLNYWSLGVEEQFYIVYPALFLFLGWWAQRARRGSFRLRITVVLVARHRCFVHVLHRVHRVECAERVLLAAGPFLGAGARGTDRRVQPRTSAHPPGLGGRRIVGWTRSDIWWPASPSPRPATTQERWSPSRLSRRVS